MIWLKSSTGKDNQWAIYKNDQGFVRGANEKQLDNKQDFPSPPLPATNWLKNNYCSLTVAVADSAALFLAYSIASFALWNLFKKSWERKKNGNSVNVGKP